MARSFAFALILVLCLTQTLTFPTGGSFGGSGGFRSGGGSIGGGFRPGGGSIGRPGGMPNIGRPGGMPNIGRPGGMPNIGRPPIGKPLPITPPIGRPLPITPKPLPRPIVTPKPPVVTPKPIVTPNPPVVTPKPIVTPKPPVVTPKPPVVTPKPPVVTPKPPVVTPKPPVVTPKPVQPTPKPVQPTPQPKPVQPAPIIPHPMPPGAKTPANVYQANPAWKNLPLGNGQTTIGKGGCVVSSLAAIADKAGIKINGATPNTVNMNDWMKANGGFGKGSSSADMTVMSKLGFKVGDPIAGSNKNTILQGMSQGKSAILNVGGHYVYATGSDATGFKVIDPGHKDIGHYTFEQVQSARLFSR